MPSAAVSLGCTDVTESVPVENRHTVQVEWADQNPEKAEEIALNVQEFVRNKLSMESIYDYMMRRLSRYSTLLTFQPKVSKKEDTLITDFQSLVRTLDLTMKKVGTPQPDVKLDRFVAFHKGDRCCTKCPDIPHFQHLCPGKDLGWLEDDERSVLRGCVEDTAGCEDGSPQQGLRVAASAGAAVAAAGGDAVIFSRPRPHPHPHPHPGYDMVMRPGSMQQFGGAAGDVPPRFKPRKKGKRG